MANTLYPITSDAPRDKFGFSYLLSVPATRVWASDQGYITQKPKVVLSLATFSSVSASSRRSRALWDFLPQLRSEWAQHSKTKKTKRPG